VADPRAAGLDAPAPGQTGEGTERRGHSALGGRPLAHGKKNARRRRAWLVFQDESGVSQRPPIRRTWAPRGETPVLIHAFNWKKLSVATALAFRWDGRCSQLFFQTRPGSYDGPSLISFLKDLKRHVRRRRITLIWDGLPAHKSHEMQVYLARQRHWLVVERLPGYAPDLNPAELVWGNVKGRELANLCADNLDLVEAELRAGLRRVARHPRLAFAFLRHTGLSL
jgi:transposase